MTAPLTPDAAAITAIATALKAARALHRRLPLAAMVGIDISTTHFDAADAGLAALVAEHERLTLRERAWQEAERDWLDRVKTLVAEHARLREENELIRAGRDSLVDASTERDALSAQLVTLREAVLDQALATAYEHGPGHGAADSERFLTPKARAALAATAPKVVRAQTGAPNALRAWTQGLPPDACMSVVNAARDAYAAARDAGVPTAEGRQAAMIQAFRDALEALAPQAGK